MKSNQRIHDLIGDFSELKVNWDGEGSNAPSNTSLEKAIELISILDDKEISIFHASPGPNGEIMIDIRNEMKSIEIIFYSDRSISVIFPEDGAPIQQAFDFSDLSNLLDWLKNPI
jgi:hypothetical protein